MKSLSLLLSFALSQVIQPYSGKYALNTTQEVKIKDAYSESTKLAFGSCFQQFNHRSDIFKYVTAQNPHLWIWMGDVAYVDYPLSTIVQRFKKTSFTSFEYVKNRYNMSLQEEHYSNMIKEVPVIGVWDDHDYGNNDGGRDFEHKHQMREIFLDFIGEFQDSERRLAKHRGIYQDYVIETKEGIKILIVLFDGRFEYAKDLDTKERLGEEQWQWFDKVLEEHSDADFTILASGVQVFADRYLRNPEGFKETSRNRLLEVLDKYQRNGVIVLSGDVHHTQFLQSPCKSAYLGYSVPEIVSSGMTHTMGTFYFKMAELMFDSITSRRFMQTEIEAIKLNYGTLDFYTDSKGNKKVKASTRTTQHGQEGLIFTREYDLKRDLQYRKSSFIFKKSCHSCLQQRFSLMIQNLLSTLIIKRNIWVFVSYTQVITIFSIFGFLYCFVFYYIAKVVVKMGLKYGPEI